ncbi:MAG: hypothetical protein IPI33_15580 [Dehalococcoidia bacterium]|nr:hypothetical protein [Dehalococcoidia bacterium]
MDEPQLHQRLRGGQRPAPRLAEEARRRHLHHGAALHQRREALRLVREDEIPLGVRDDRHHAHHPQLVEDGPCLRRHPTGRELHQERPASGQRRQRPRGALLQQLHEVVPEPDLGAGEHPRRSAQFRVQLGQQRRARRRVLVQPRVPQHVRRGDDGLRPLRRRGPAEGQRVVPPRGAVVDPRQRVEVEVDQPRSATFAAADASSRSCASP